jgi:hypothetical protein
MINPVHIMDLLHVLEEEGLIRHSCKIESDGNEDLWVDYYRYECTLGPHGDCHTRLPICFSTSHPLSSEPKVCYFPHFPSLPLSPSEFYDRLAVRFKLN